MGISKSAWIRELKRSVTGRLVQNVQTRGTIQDTPREAPQQIAEKHQAQRGPPMKITNLAAQKFARLVKEERRSSYNARMTIRDTHPNWHVPFQRTFRNHIETEYIGILHGETLYHLGAKRRPRTPPHPVTTALVRRHMANCPPKRTPVRKLDTAR